MIILEQIKSKRLGVPVVAQRLLNPNSIHEDLVRSLALVSGLGIQYYHELWESPYAALKRHTQKKEKKKSKRLFLDGWFLNWEEGGCFYSQGILDNVWR